MKKSRYTEEQIIGILKQHEGWREDGGCVPRARDQRGDILWLEVEVRRAGSERGAASEGDGRLEPSSEVVGGRTELARRGAEGSHTKKRLELAGLREEVLRHARQAASLRVCWRACTSHWVSFFF